MKQAPTASCCATLCLVLASAQFSSAATWYVEDDSLGGDGTSWPQAFRFLQDALLVAQDGDEIRVADGTYRPDERSDWPLGGTGDRAATFQLLNGVAIRGGYAGLGAPNPDARDIDAYETILSGDLNEDDEDGGFVDNGYHVVTGSGTDETSLVDGFTICSGNALPLPKDNGGGGMCNVSGSPTITRCTFRENQGDRGGALQNALDSNPFFESCIFEFNHGNYGGAVNSDASSAPIFNNCVFEQNSSDFGGGIRGGASTLIDCFFSMNVADRGGAINGGSPLLVDCVFADNSAGQGAALGGFFGDVLIMRCHFNRNFAQGGGGALFFLEGYETLIGCSFTGNSGRYGGAIANNLVQDLLLADCHFAGNVAEDHGGAIASTSSVITAIRCTFSDNSAGENGGAIHDNSGGLTLSKCIFRENSSSEGGALGTLAGNPRLNNCVLAFNSATNGGAMHCRGGNPALTGCVMKSNSATNGGALASIGSTVSLENCTIAGNSTIDGSAVAAIGIPPIPYVSNFAITNSILWNGGNEIFNLLGISQFAVTYSNVETGWSGIGNIDVDPEFEADGFHLRQGSPCINKGDPNYLKPPGETDIDGYPRVMGGRIDMGADEFTRRVLLLAEPAPSTD
jgi:predicted outer membrane repeat protein